jgi:hypothetical protein
MILIFSLTVQSKYSFPSPVTVSLVNSTFYLTIWRVMHNDLDTVLLLLFLYAFLSFTSPF